MLVSINLVRKKNTQFIILENRYKTYVIYRFPVFIVLGGFLTSHGIIKWVMLICD